MKKWKIENQQEFNFDECYLENYPPLDLSKKEYQKDRNLQFYKLQNELLLTYNETGISDRKILWEMFPFIEGVVSSLAKKNVCVGCYVPDFESKSLEATLKVMEHYEKFPYFRAKKLENVAFHKVREVFLDKNLQINERTCEALENTSEDFYNETPEDKLIKEYEKLEADKKFCEEFELRGD